MISYVYNRITKQNEKKNVSEKEKSRKKNTQKKRKITYNLTKERHKVECYEANREKSISVCHN